MNIDDFFFRLYLTGGGEERFLGSCFPVTPDGGLLTCRHVVDVEKGEGSLAVHDNSTGWKIHFDEVVYPEKPGLDLAFIPNALKGAPRPFLPILTPPVLKTGEDVYSYGFFRLREGPIEQGYFSGRIVNFTQSDQAEPVWSLTLPYPVIEGMSGSPVLTYHNGPKVVGVGYGNRSTRILASEVVDFQEGEERFRETINRIVEFGLAYHCAEVAAFLVRAGARGVVVSQERVEGQGFE